MRLTSATFDKLKSEKQHFADEASELRNKNALLVKKIKTGNDPQGLIDQICKDKSNQLFLNENIVNLKGELSLRESKLEALTKELVIAHRSIDVQSKYENMQTLQGPSVTNSREIMRTLYFDMGKKQADLHCVTLALADVTKKLEATRAELFHTCEMRDVFHSENEKLKGNLEYLNRQSVEYNDEIVLLRQELFSRGRLCEQLQLQVETISRDASEAKAHSEEELLRRQTDIEGLRSAVAMLEHDKAGLQQSMHSQQELSVKREAVHNIAMEELTAEVQALRERNEQLGDQVQQCAALQTKADALRARVFDADQMQERQEKRITELGRVIAQREQTIVEANITAQMLDDSITAVHAELTQLRERQAATCTERDEAVDALRHTMRATRDLSQKYHREREGREASERTNAQLLQAKANLSAATLDALYQERRKSAALEKSLALVPLVLKWRAACLPPTGVAGRSAAVDAAGAGASSTTLASNEAEIAAGEQLHAQLITQHHYLTILLLSHLNISIDGRLRKVVQHQQEQKYVSGRRHRQQLGRWRWEGQEEQGGGCYAAAGRQQGHQLHRAQHLRHHAAAGDARGSP